jgi:hypothetical protein
MGCGEEPDLFSPIPMRRSYRFHFAAAIFFAGALVFTGNGFGQGLIGIGNEGSRTTESIPLKVGVGAWAGYDTNANTSVGGTRQKTAFYGGRATLRYAYVTKQTRFDLRFHFAGLHQEAGGGTLDDMVYSSRMQADFAHRFNQRVSMTNNALIAWDTEPDFMLAATGAQRNDQYLYFYDRAALWLSLTNRLTSVTSYTAEGIGYENSGLARTEDRASHTVAQQMRFAWSNTSTVKAEYRYGRTNYDTAPLDSQSHYLLAGIDQQFGDAALLTLLAGAEYRDYEALSALWKPYAEASLRYRVDDVTTLQWLARAGLDNSEVFGYDSRYSIRTGVAVVRKITDRMGVSAGVTYVHSDLEGSDGEGDISERGVQAHAELTYALTPNLDLTTGYQYTDFESGEDGRDYDRHRVSVAAQTTF